MVIEATALCHNLIHRSRVHWPSECNQANHHGYSVSAGTPPTHHPHAYQAVRRQHLITVPCPQTFCTPSIRSYRRGDAFPTREGGDRTSGHHTRHLARQCGRRLHKAIERSQICKISRAATSAMTQHQTPQTRRSFLGFTHEGFY